MFTVQKDNGWLSISYKGKSLGVVSKDADPSFMVMLEPTTVEPKYEAIRDEVTTDQVRKLSEELSILSEIASVFDQRIVVSTDGPDICWEVSVPVEALCTKLEHGDADVVRRFVSEKRPSTLAAVISV